MDSLLFETMDVQPEHGYTKRLLSAMEATRAKFKPFLDASVNRKDREARKVMIDDDVRQMVSKYVDPLPSTMRRIHAGLKVAEVSSPTSTWEFDFNLNGWRSSCADKQTFLCTECGRGLPELGFQHCKCGATWNGYEIKDETKESSAPLVVWRKIAEEDTKIAKVAQEDETFTGDDLADLEDEASDAGVEFDIPEDDILASVESDMIKESPEDEDDYLDDDPEDDFKQAFIMGYKRAAMGKDIHDDCSDGFLAGYEAWTREV